MVNLLEQAINSDDGDRAAKVIQDTRHRIGRCRQLVFPKTWPPGREQRGPYPRGVAIATTLTARSKSLRARC
jgi:hypothetical protein